MHMPTARLEWFRRNLKFCCGTLGSRRETPGNLLDSHRYLDVAQAGDLGLSLDDCPERSVPGA